jgi:hypothetical protein
LPIENRAYGPDCGAEERAEIAARVWSPEDRIVALDEIPIQSVFTIELMQDRVDEISKGWADFCFLVDLTHAGWPSAEVRETMKRRTRTRTDRLRHVAVVVGPNLVMGAMARMVGFALGFRKLTVHADREGALEDLRRELGR